MKNILITGAASGMGKALATALSNENLLLVDKDSKKLKTVAKNLNCKYFDCDISNIENLNKLQKYLKNDFNKIDVLINCAGVWTKGELSNLCNEHFAKLNTLERIKDVIDTNTFGTIAMINIVMPFFIKANSGQIVNINSQSGVQKEEFCPVYNASKHGSYNYRRAIESDLAKHNIKITDICPGLVKTDFYINAEDKLPDEIMNLGLDTDAVTNTVLYVLNLPKNITIPSIEIKNMLNY